MKDAYTAVIKKAKHRKVIDPRGRIWTVAKVEWKNAEEEDFRFWYEGLTPEERVDTVAAALESCLKTRGRNGISRLRRVHRRIERPWGTLSYRRRSRSGLSRPASRTARP